MRKEGQIAGACMGAKIFADEGIEGEGTSLCHAMEVGGKCLASVQIGTI